MTNTFLKVN